MASKARIEASRKGGLSISEDRAHMAAIGRVGGLKVSKNRAYMAQIGRKGGASARKSKKSESTLPRT